MNIDPKTIIIIEDSLVGIQSAKDNAVFCIAFNRYDDPIIADLADVLVKTYGDLRQIFGIGRKDSQQLH